MSDRTQEALQKLRSMGIDARSRPSRGTPRQARDTLPVACEGKKRYRSRKKAQADARALREHGDNARVYTCVQCGRLHVGTRPRAAP